MHRGVIDHILRGRISLDVGVVLGGIVLCGWMALDYGIEVELGHAVNEWNVEDFGGGAVANNADIIHRDCCTQIRWIALSS